VTILSILSKNLRNNLYSAFIPVILISVVFMVNSCSQSVYLKNSSELKDIITKELQDEKVRVTLKDSTQKNVFVHSVIKDSLITVSYDRKNKKADIDHFSVDSISSISHMQGDASLPGLILGASQGLPIMDINWGYAPIGFIFPSIFIISSGLSWAIGSKTKIEKIYNMQIPTPAKFLLGINWGITFSHINQDYGSLSAKSWISRDAGIVFDYNFYPSFALQFDYNFLRTGARWEKSVDYMYYNLNSLMSSLIIKTNYPFSKISSKFMLCAGLYHEYVLSAKQEWVVENDLQTNPDSPSIPKDFTDEINKNLFGTILGVQLPFFYDEMRCQFLWYYSVKELYKNNWPRYRFDFSNKDNFHKNMFIFSIDYLLVY
jgi:hypothetical protein